MKSLSTFKTACIAAVAGLITAGALSGPAKAFNADVVVLGCVFDGKTLLVDSLNVSGALKLDVAEEDFCADALKLLIRENFTGNGFVSKENEMNPNGIVMPNILPSPGIVNGDSVKMFWQFIREGTGFVGPID